MFLRTVVAFAVVSGLALPGAAQPVSGISGGVSDHVVGSGETLQRLSARFGVDAAVIAEGNGLAPTAKLPAGLALRIDNRHIVPVAMGPGLLVINVPQRMLFYEHDGAVVAVPIAVGKAAWRTPTREFTVLTKEVNPTWEVPRSIQEESRRAGRSLPAVVPPGPNNPLGKFWLGLSIPGVGIHGTNAPSSIYRATTHGCIRVGPDDIASLFPRVAVGARGLVIYEPILLAVSGVDIYLEVHPDVYRRQPGDPVAIVRALADQAGLAEHIDWHVARRVVADRHGIARSVGTWENPLPRSELSR
jgi:L,D-transpeptidase ErfK/SrfK